MKLYHTFSNHLNTLRQTRHLTVTELAKLAGVSQPLISNLIHGRETIGEYTARKLASALQLQGNELQEFVYLAINDCTQKVLNSSKAFPSQVLNVVANELNALGISPTRITRCVMNSDDADAALFLDDGKSAYINVEIAIR